MRVKNFLKSTAHKHKDPQVRLSWVTSDEADDPASQSVLTELALNDEALPVRRAAIGKSDDIVMLLQLLDAGSSGELEDAVGKRLAGLLEAGEVSDVSVGQLLQSHTRQLAATVAAHSSAVSQREQALTLILDEVTLLQVVQQARYHDTRLAAASRITRHDGMQAALSACRSRDKVVAKLLQQRLDSEAAAEAARIATAHAVTTTVESMQALASSVWSPQHSGRHQALLDRWKNFDSADTADRAEALLVASKAVNQIIETQVKEAALRAEQQSLEASDVATGSKADTSSVNSTSSATAEEVGVDQAGKSASSDQVSDNDKTNTPTAVKADPAWQQDVEVIALCKAFDEVQLLDLGAVLGTLENKEATGARATALLAHGRAVAVLFDPPFDYNKARPQALKQHTRRIDSLIDTRATLGGLTANELPYLKHLGDYRLVLEQRLDKARQESSDRIKATHRQFAALAGTVADGKWGPANSMLHRLQKKLSAMEPAERSGLNEKLTRAESQLKEMGDWQDFAARPKLETLCVSMEALPAQELAPDALAKKVRKLQANWKALGASSAANELWPRFKLAGDTAYEPCKAWFEKKQVERQLKLDAKAGICSQLEEAKTLLSLDDADWKEINRQVGNAKRDWSRNRIQDRKPDKSLESRFSAALKPLEDALALQYDANRNAKQELVEKITSLAEGDITQHSANQAKRLQNTWKQIGIMRRKEDQALWELFNGHCRTVFKHQHEVDREKRNATLAHVFRAKDIIKLLKQLAKGSSIDDAEVQILLTEFQNLADFPPRDDKFLKRDFRAATDACSRVQASSAKRREQAEYEERLRLVGLCEQLEHAVELPESRTSTLQDDIMHSWSATEVRLSRDIATQLDARRDAAVKHLKAGTTPDYDAHDTLRRDLLIRMEIAAEIETPTEDKSRRMVYQLENLKEGMTSAGVSDQRATLTKLEEQWLTAPPVRQHSRDSLQSRYLKAVGR
ncbi:MAG: DUF349 domain-containing protein [Granulosicoccus sp.]